MILKPGRYIDSEWNAIHKGQQQGMLRVALCFPDIYEIGMSHLGMKILYGALNREKDVFCERVFAPWSDMERKMREENGALRSLEGRAALKDFDVVGFSLQYEMNCVDVLNMLDLGGIPVFSKDRDDTHPIVIAGGPCAFNPEPMAEFIDAFVIGEAEEAVLEIARAVKSVKCQVKGERDKVLKEISKIESVYVPLVMIPPPPRGWVTPAVGEVIKKRIVKNLDSSYFPTDIIVPYIQIVHDRIGIEIMRGCPHKCKFCQACKIFHPLRIRSVKRILEIAEESVAGTGYEEISLLSLSTGDYPHLEELVAKIEERFKGMGVKISLPSLRAQSFKAQEDRTIIKRAGLTFAPETGSDRLRKMLNKNMTNQDIIQKSTQALRSGWKKVKLYFMIGLPGEEQDDLDAIIDMVGQIKSVSLSISSFIPKPHSGFEREGMAGLEELSEKKKYLGSMLRSLSSRRHIKAEFHDLETSRIEAVLSRGDRRVGQVIHAVWQKGARLQAWNEYFDCKLWEEGFRECGVDPDRYLRKAGEGEGLPWGFIKG